MAVAPLRIAGSATGSFAPQVDIRSIAPVQAMPGPEAAFGALGDALARMGFDALAAQAATRQANATSAYVTGLADLEERYRADADYATMSQRFAADAGELESRLSAEAHLSEPDHAQLRLQFTRMRTAAEGGVSQRAFALEAGANVSALDNLELALTRKASTAASAEERQTTADVFGQRVGAAVAAGWITPAAGQTYLERFAGSVDEADALRMVREDPARAAALLAQPDAFVSLDPVARERYRNAAAGAVDDDAIARLGLLAETRPYAAAMTLNRLPDRVTTSNVFDSAILPAEASGPSAVSPKGAIGEAQILVGTARDMAKALGLDDVAALTDADLATRLKEDPALNKQLGRAYFDMLSTRYEGNAVAAIAGYNAGPARADKWLAAAKEKFGDGFTAAEFASLIDIAETKDYVAKAYAAAGADIAGAGLSPTGYARAYTRVGSAIDAAATAERKTIRDMASLERDANNPVPALEQALNVPDGQIADYMAVQHQACAAGDLEACKALRKLDTALAVHPMSMEFWRQPIDATLAQLALTDQAVRENPTPELVRRVETLRAVADRVVETRNTDPVALVQRATGETVVLDTQADPRDGAFVLGLEKRGKQALDGVTRFGASPKPFHPEEATALAGRFDRANDEDRLAMVQTWAATMPEAVQPGLVDQLGLGHEVTIAMRLFSQGRGDIAGKVLKGSALMGVEGVEKQVTTLREAAATTIGGDLYIDSSMLDGVISAASALYVANRGRQALFADPNQKAMEAAIEQVTGEIVERNGFRWAAPIGLSASAFDSFLKNLSDEQLAAAGGADSLSADDLARHAVLVQKAPGSMLYLVGVPDAGAPDGLRIVTSRGASGPGRTDMIGPLIIDVAQLATLPGAPYRWPAARALQFGLGVAPDPLQEN